MKKIVGIFLLLITLHSCKVKPEPTEMIAPVTFFANGLLDTNTFTFEVGKNNYFMKTNWTNDLSLNLKNLTGSIKKNCNLCQENFEVKFIGNDTGNSYQTNLTLVPGQKVYLNSDSSNNTKYKVSFTSMENGALPASYTWTFSDGTSSTDRNPIKTFTSPKNLTVNYLVKYANNCQADLSFPVYIKKISTSKPINIYYGFNSNRLVQFSPIVVDSGIIQGFKWDFGDGKTSLDRTPTHEYPDSGAYRVCLSAYLLNDSIINCTKVRTPDKKSCSANVSVQQSLDFEKLFMNQVQITYTNENGEQFGSNHTQDANATFEIISVAPYLKNELGMNTKLIEIKANCTLTNGSGKKIKLTNFTGKIGVAIP